MTTQTIDTEKLKAKLDLRELAARHVELRRHTRKEMCGPCPRCGGTDRFFVARDYWGCRQCNTGGDVFAFVQWIENVSFLEAATMLEADTLSAPVRPQPARPQPAAPDWNADRAQAHLAACQAALLDSPAATYLAARALIAETAAAYAVGYDAERNAVALPWLRGGRLSGIRYRLLAPADPRRKMIAEPGSSFAGLLFGAQALLPGWTQPLPNGTDVLAHRSLILVEGELNAMSIYQLAYDARCDVLSLGSESAHIPDTFLPVAARYRCVLVWMDKEGRARAEAGRLNNAAAAWSECDGCKADANDHLQAGTLGPLLASLLTRATPPHGQEALRWDLVDAGLAA